MRVLKQGMSGPDVSAWQTFLVGLGAEIVADGSFGPATKEATANFQRLHELEPDGVVGRGTLGKAMTMGFGNVEDDETEGGPNWPPRPEGIRSLTGVERAAKFGSFAYRPAPTPGNPEGIVILDDWAKTHIVTIEIPQLRGVTGAPASGKVPFHKDGAPRLVALFQAWEDEGLLPLVLSWGGSWVPRFIRGSRSVLSNHSTGTAFDINAAWNSLGAEGALVGKRGSVRKLVPLAFDHGFTWGGWFSGRPDAMHFELLLGPLTLKNEISGIGAKPFIP
jgi:D-alanyl-D-alanine carboxypeptidase/Putative peptidoglycan binding domain